MILQSAVLDQDLQSAVLDLDQDLQSAVLDQELPTWTL